MVELEIDLGQYLHKINGYLLVFPHRLTKKEQFTVCLADTLYKILYKNGLIITLPEKAKITEQQVMSIYGVSQSAAFNYLKYVDNEMKKLDKDMSYIDSGILYIDLNKLANKIKEILEMLVNRIKTKGAIMITYTDKDIIKQIIASFLKNKYKPPKYRVIEDLMPVKNGRYILVIYRYK